MSLSLKTFRAELYKILDQIIETGIPVDIQHNGHKIRITLADGPSKLDRLTYQPNVINGDPESLIQNNWLQEPEK